MRPAFLRTLTATTLVSAIGLVSAMGGTARADCQPDPAASGQTVTCSATDADGFDAGAATNLTFNVLAGATVTTAANTSVVILNGGNTVSNAGLIVQSVGANAGILLQGDANAVTNLGTIQTASTGVAIQGNSNASTIRNLGTMTGRSGIQVTGNGNVLANSGTIVFNGGIGGTFGLFAAGNANTLTNSGTMVGSGPGNFGSSPTTAAPTY